MRRTITYLAALAIMNSLLLVASPAEAQRRRPPPRAEVVAWTADGSLVVFAQPRRDGRRRTVELVARRVPSGEVIGHRRVFPGRCARVIERRVAISHACALAELRPELPRRYRRAQFHIAANERGRISQITLRADGSIVEHELPGLGLVIRGRTEDDDDRRFAILEVSPIDQRSDDGRVLDRRPVRPRARRRWTLLKAGEDHYIIIGQGVLRRVGRRPTEGRLPQRDDMARARSTSG